MSKLTFERLLEAGVHFGHLKRKWNPAMAPYIFEEKKGIHIIDLNKTIEILTRGREIFNIEKPEFKIGNKASLALFTINDYEFSKTDILSKSKNSAFLGMKMKGKAVGVINENMVTINE